MGKITGTVIFTKKFRRGKKSPSPQPGGVKDEEYRAI